MNHVSLPLKHKCTLRSSFAMSLWSRKLCWPVYSCRYFWRFHWEYSSKFKKSFGNYSLSWRKNPPARFQQRAFDLGCGSYSLPASPKTERNTKGYSPDKRNRTGRQLVRVSAPQYGEIILRGTFSWETPFLGNTTSRQVLKGTINKTERILGLDLDKAKRKRTLVRTDGGFETDGNINWILWRGY